MIIKISVLLSKLGIYLNNSITLHTRYIGYLQKYFKILIKFEISSGDLLFKIY